LWFILYDNSETTGVIKLEYLNFSLWIPHIIIHKQHRGQDSEIWGKLVIQYMKDVYGVNKFLALTPYKNAKRYAEKVGFKYIHTVTKSFKKDGELLDQYLLEFKGEE